jgi:hypothetical protein
LRVRHHDDPSIDSLVKHEIGHMCGLARTTPSTFLLMGADACHHPGLIRPNEGCPLPNIIHLSPSPCPCAAFVNLHPEKSTIQPYYKIALNADGTGKMFSDIEAANSTLERLKRLDADERVFVVLSHDHSILGVVDFFPMTANSWQEKNWKEKSRWQFLSDFDLP